MLHLLRRLRIDPYLLILVAALVAASVAPARGAADTALGWVADGAIALLFFLQGARLPREAIINGLSAGRLHLLIVILTYALFPVLALALNAAGALPASLRPGLLFLACLPSTVQSSIAFVSIARGNVAAAVCAASLSNILAVAMTPLLVGVLMQGQGGFSWITLKAVVLQLLAPFVIGQLARPVAAGFVAKHSRMLGYIDRGSILLVVYMAFSHAVAGGFLSALSPLDLTRLILVALGLLGAVLAAAVLAARVLRLDRAEAVVAVICGSQKSLATGAPMAGLLFPAAVAGAVIVPVLVFHQIQLIVASIIVRRYGRQMPKT